MKVENLAEAWRLNALQLLALEQWGQGSLRSARRQVGRHGSTMHFLKDWSVACNALMRFGTKASPEERQLLKKKPNGVQT